jgi:hypothetical protein
VGEEHDPGGVLWHGEIALEEDPVGGDLDNRLTHRDGFATHHTPHG